MMKAGYRVFYVSIIITKQSKHISKIGRVISKVVIRILGGRERLSNFSLKKKKKNQHIEKNTCQHRHSRQAGMLENTGDQCY